MYLQSGGPTAVINTTAYGVIAQMAETADSGRKLYIARHGILGVIRGDLLEPETDPEKLLRLRETPSMAFGSTRYQLRTDEDYRKAEETLCRFDIGQILVNGGNGSAAAAMRLQQRLDADGIDCGVLLIPKTVDNDVAGIDHAPGFPSAARHVVISVAELIRDMWSYETDLIMAVEVMGRNTGFLAGASKAAGLIGHAPDLIYVPERVFDPEQFVRDVREVIARKGKCFAVIPEGVRTASGKYLFEDTTVNKGADPSVNMGGITEYLSVLLRAHFTCKIRCIDLGLMQRCAAHDASPVDREEAETLGRMAVQYALSGEREKMLTIRRGNSGSSDGNSGSSDGNSGSSDGSNGSSGSSGSSDGSSGSNGGSSGSSGADYAPEYGLMPLGETAGRSAVLPEEYIGEDGHSVKDSYLDYVLPLLGDLPRMAELTEL